MISFGSALDAQKLLGWNPSLRECTALNSIYFVDLKLIFHKDCIHAEPVLRMLLFPLEPSSATRTWIDPNGGERVAVISGSWPASRVLGTSTKYREHEIIGGSIADREQYPSKGEIGLLPSHLPVP